MPELGLGTDRCECTGCGEFFNSVYAFDKHRVLVSDKDATDELRRCLTPAELLAKGWGKNKGGFWVTSLMPQGIQREEAA